MNISKSNFECYRNMKYTIPEDKFYLLIKMIKPNKREYFINNIAKRNKNWGCVLGGQKAYQINKEYFKIGRKKGAENSRRKRIKVLDKNLSEITLSKELCEVVGAFMGDGHAYNIKKRHYRIQFSGDKRLDLDYYNNRINPVIQTIFHSNPKIKKIDNCNSLRVDFNSKFFYVFLKNFLNLTSSRKTYIIRIPKVLFEEQNEKYLLRMVRGLFDTDGGIYLDKRIIYKTPYPRIIFHTISKKLHKQLMEYLSKHFKIYSYQRKYKNPNNKDSYSIEIYGQKQLKKWMSLIGFSNPRHLSKIATVA
ncbi:hypothetical protein K8R33_04970 [archaeon]|nr:hypothetical protein [archaeon]